MIADQNIIHAPFLIFFLNWFSLCFWRAITVRTNVTWKESKMEKRNRLAPICNWSHRWICAFTSDIEGWDEHGGALSFSFNRLENLPQVNLKHTPDFTDNGNTATFWSHHEHPRFTQAWCHAYCTTSNFRNICICSFLVISFYFWICHIHSDKWTGISG